MTFSMSQVKGIVGGALLTVALFLSGFFVMLTPVPLFVIGATRGRSVFIGAVSLAVLGLASLYRAATSTWFVLPGSDLTTHFPSWIIPLFGAATLGFYVVAAFFLVEGLRQRWSVTKMFGWSLGGGLFVFLAVGGVAVVVGDFSFGEGLRNYVGTIVDEVVKLRGFTINREEMVTMAMGVLPAIMVIFSIVSVTLSGVVGFKFLRRHPAFHHCPRPASFKLPDLWVWVPIVSGVLFFFNTYTVQSDRLAMIAINVVFVSALLAFLQGFAVISFFLQRLRTRWFRTVIYMVILFFFQTIGIAVAGVGLADVWMNFRKGGTTCK